MGGGGGTRSEQTTVQCFQEGGVGVGGVCHSTLGGYTVACVFFRRVGVSPRRGREGGVCWQTLLSSSTKVSSYTCVRFQKSF